MLDIPTGLTPVLNEYYVEVVFIPTELPIISTLKKRDDIDMLVIDHRDYDDLKEQYEGEYTFEDKGDVPSRAVFASRYYKTNGYGVAYITIEGWGKIFDYLKESGFSVTDMLSGFPKFANSFQEDTPADILDNLDIDTDGAADSDLPAMAVNAIHDNDNTSYVATHTNGEGIEWVIYTQS